MQVPLEISFHGVDRSAWAEAFIRRQVERMDRYAGGDVIGCRVALELPHRHQHRGKPYHVRVEITLPPRKDLVADIYFHRNAVLHDDYQRLAVGTQVRYVEFMGEEDPQASTVQIIDKAGARAGIGEQAVLS